MIKRRYTEEEFEARQERRKYWQNLAITSTKNKIAKLSRYIQNDEDLLDRLPTRIKRRKASLEGYRQKLKKELEELERIENTDRMDVTYYDRSNEKVSEELQIAQERYDGIEDGQV